MHFMSGHIHRSYGLENGHLFIIHNRSISYAHIIEVLGESIESRILLLIIPTTKYVPGAGRSSRVISYPGARTHRMGAQTLILKHEYA